MHALCTIVARTLREAYDSMRYYSDEQTWDYACVGGRYANLIPVSKKCKTYHDGSGWPELPGDEFPYTDRMNPNPDLKYTNIARIRNINQAERARIIGAGGLDVFMPYTMIICHDDGWYEWLDIEQMGQGQLENLANVLRQPDKQSWFMVVVDYHY